MLFFSFNRKLKNVGFWLFLIMNILNFISFIFYFINGINPIKNYIRNEMNNKGYISDNNKNIQTTEQNFDEDKKEKTKN